MDCVITETISPPPFNKCDILRYLGCKNVDTDVLNLLDCCLRETGDVFSYKLCYCKSNLHIDGDMCKFDTFSVSSKHLAKHLEKYNKAIIMAATVGVGIDRLISKYAVISPSKALMFQAIGAERIEALCNTFQPEHKRFSPGYGDLPLSTQKEIFSLLQCQTKIGLTLNNSLLMSPTKSVTAFIGIKEEV